MVKYIKDYTKKRPRLYDILKRVYRLCSTSKPEEYNFFDSFSRKKGRKVSFIQVGASDGLQCDPIREFVVRDRWEGIFIEPLPAVFEVLKRNYCRQAKSQHLVFLNAAISNKSGEITFWTFSDEVLNSLSYVERTLLTQKSSVNIDHLRGWLPNNDHHYKNFCPTRVKALTLDEVIDGYWGERNIDLLVIDAEGHESSIINSLTFKTFSPEVIFFESHHLGDEKASVYETLRDKGYKLLDLGGDTVATKQVHE